MSAVPPVSPAAGAALCWNCQQPLQAGSARCLWCGVPQQSAAQLVVAPGPLPSAGDTASSAALAAPAMPGVPLHSAAIPAAPRAPRGAATLGPAFAGRAAGVGPRIVAFTIDLVVVFGVATATLLVANSVLLGAVVLVEAIVILGVIQARTGASVGNAILRLRVARSDAPYSPGVGRSAVRILVTGVGFLVAGVGAWVVVASAAFDPSGRRRSWADRGAGTVVVAVPPRARRAVASQSAVAPAGVISVASGVPAVLPPTAPASYIPPMPGNEPVAETPAIERSIVLAAPQVISTAVRTAIDEESASASVTGAAGAPFAASPVDAGPSVAAPAARAASTAGSDGTLLLVFDTGQREQLPTPVSVNLGRSPVITEQGDKLVAVSDPEATVSKTHVRLEHSRGRTWVTDGGSTNGTDLLTDDGETIRLAPGDRVALDEGVRVRIGNRTFTVSLLLDNEKAS
jgi:RDD family/FHA domain